jgi:hypothetical protein
MNKSIILITILFITTTCVAQDFSANINTAKASYKSGNLEDAHFALQKAMQELDMIIGKEVLKLLPVKMDSLSVNANADNVNSNVGFVGATVSRNYGKFDKKAELSIISNSPMVAMLNSLFNSPMLAGMNNDPNVKTIKVQGYKARLERKNSNVDGKFDYEVQVPLGSALITFTLDETNETEITAMMNTIPLAQIAKLIQ